MRPELKRWRATTVMVQQRPATTAPSLLWVGRNFYRRRANSPARHKRKRQSCAMPLFSFGTGADFWRGSAYDRPSAFQKRR
jgi:hypothetical protein